MYTIGQRILKANEPYISWYEYGRVAFQYVLSLEQMAHLCDGDDSFLGTFLNGRFRSILLQWKKKGWCVL